jgi:hypothetical protein
MNDESVLMLQGRENSSGTVTGLEPASVLPVSMVIGVVVVAIDEEDEETETVLENCFGEVR